MKRLLLFVGFIFVVTTGYTQLAVGDIAFVQYNADGTDNFAFVALVDIPASEVISFTDNEEDEIPGGEGTIIWTAPPGGVSCGTVVTITSAPSATIGTVSETNSLIFSTGGDGIIAYQGLASSPTFITALGNDGLGGGDYSQANEGNLPSGLTLGVNAQSIAEIDNSIYNGSILNDTKANLLAAIYNFSNWSGDNTVNQTFSGTFSVTTCVSGPVITTSLSLLTGFDYIEGDADGSDSQSFSVSATGFAANSTITLTAPTNFLISTTDGSGYLSTFNLTTDGLGDLVSTDIFVILESGLFVGNYGLSDLDISGPSANTVFVALSGSVTTNFVNFAVAVASANEIGGTHVITVTSGIAGAHTVDVVVTGGSATDPIHYSYSTQTVSFVGNMSQTISITLNDNALCEGDVNVIFELQNAVSCTIGPIVSHDLTIVDDEQVFIPIDFQGFEGGGWAYTTNPLAYSNIDTWAIVGSIGSINPASGSLFWGMEDLDNPTAGAGVVHTLTFNKDISTFSNVVIDFKWSALAYNGTDNLKYEFVYDGIPQGEITICVSGGCSSGWTNIISPIPNSVGVVELILKAFQNGNGQYAGFDDITISGLDCSTCSEPTITSIFSGSSPSAVTTTSANVAWNLGGDGDNTLLLMQEGNPVDSNPIDNSGYNATSVFGTGDQLDVNNFIIYNGNGNSVVVTGLNPGTEYFTEIFEYNCLPGQEDYLISSSSTDVFVSKPEIIDDLATPCVTNNTIDISWNDPLIGNHNGFLIVARQESTPGGVTALDPSIALGENLDYSLASTYGIGPDFSRVLYNGTGNNVTVTGLTTGVGYTFRVYAYAIGTTEYRYSDPTSTSQMINQIDVPNYGGLAGDTQVTLNWSLPSTGCWDEVLIMADGIAGITQTPTGDGSAYVANAVFGSGTSIGPPAGFVVYKGTGTGVMVTNLNNTTEYSFMIFVRSGTDWSLGKEVILEPSTTTTLEAGDLAIVAVFDNIPTIGDEVCFVAFEDISESTSIDFTDNGYEHTASGFWGGNEGVVRMQRTGGGDIAAGQTICIQGTGNSSSDFDVFLCGVLDNANWTIYSLNGGGILDFNVTATDQIWIMQGGVWTGGSNSQDGLYSGNVLYGWTGVGWESAPNYNSPSGSTLYTGSKCFSADLDGLADIARVKYVGLFTAASKLEWITRISDINNWTGYPNHGSYNTNGPDYVGSCVSFPVNSGTISEGIWTGAQDDQWFECGNWSNLKVPTATSDVQIPMVTNDAVIDATHADASIYGSIASVNALTISGSVEVFDATDQLLVNGDIFIADNAALINQDGGNIEILGSLNLVGANSLLDMNSPTTTSTLTLHGNWINGAASNGFIENNSLVDFVGLGTQIIDGSSILSGTETFYNVSINKPVGTKVELAGSDMNVSNQLQFGTGIIDAASDDVKVVVTNNAVMSITGYEAPNATGVYPVNDGFVEGRLERAVLTGIYDFPVGDRPSGLGYNPVNMNITSGTGNVSAIFDPASPGIMNVYDNTQLCSSTQRILDYEEFANDGYWNLTGPAGMLYTVTMHPNTGLNAPFAPPPNNEYRLMRAPSGTAGAETNVWPLASAYEGDICTFTGYAAASGTYTGFSDFAIQGDILNPLLPIELLFFEAKNQERDINLSWMTATEINNNLFKLYHSIDGLEWEQINVQNGAGTITEEQSYSFIHKNPSWGVHYYQLQQVDFDGASSMSEIEVAEIGSNDDITLYPVPASNTLYIDVASVLDARSIRINNEQGQLISVWTIENNKLNIARLNSGVYFITFIGQENTVVKKFIKISTE
ncbi:MAG: hypothetical protein ACI8XB_001147 [Patiriisocius sp.]|jgi:hypothetical protein